MKENNTTRGNATPDEKKSKQADRTTPSLPQELPEDPGQDQRPQDNKPPHDVPAAGQVNPQNLPQAQGARQSDRGGKK